MLASDSLECKSARLPRCIATGVCKAVPCKRTLMRSQLLCKGLGLEAPAVIWLLVEMS